MTDPKPKTPLPWKWSNKLPCIWLGANDAPVGGLMDPDHPAKDSDMAYALHAANSLPALLELLDRASDMLTDNVGACYCESMEHKPGCKLGKWCTDYARLEARNDA